MISKKDFIQLFLDLTEYTVPHGLEYRLEKFLPTGYKTDRAGMNYYIEVGKSETLFECHLDTAGYEPEKVTHVIEGDIIKTDGSTILGGDNKAGVVILLSMIKEKKPGVYYFFIGEERNGKGSRAILASNPDYFRKFKRSIAFDRKGYGSVVNIQFGRPCCSSEFEEEVVKNLEKNGIPWDKTLSRGMGTDNAILMDIIPEVTNISSGVFEEHSTREYIDINYTYNLYQAVMKINWEDLPTIRIPMSEREEYRMEQEIRARKREEVRKVRKKEEADKWMKDYKEKNKSEDLGESVNNKFIKNFNDFKNKKR